MKLLAFACFVCAAFAWVPPWLDRVGMAALGLAFLALAVGRPLTEIRIPPVSRELPSPPPEADIDEAMVDAYLATLQRERS